MRITRTRTLKDVTSTEIAYCITSAPQNKASPELLLSVNRGHWGIENQLHYVRDVSLNEDRRFHRKNPALFASLNNLAISLSRLAGGTKTFIPTFQRLFRAQPQLALRAMGLAQ